MNGSGATNLPICQSTDLPVSPSGLSARVIAFIRSRGRPAWLVGGYVRDGLMGRPSHDLDVIVPEGGVTLTRKIADTFGGASFVLDAERDVGRAILPDTDGATLEVDVARLRMPALLDDLSLRDFTVNALALEIGGGDMAGQMKPPRQVEDSGVPNKFGPFEAQIYDPFGGRDDLARRQLRAVTEGAFRDDPLRALRAVRQGIELGLRIEEATYNLIRRDAPLLAAVSGERVRDELLRIIGAPGAWQHVRLLASLNLLPVILPEAAATAGVTQSPPHYQDVFDHTRAVLAHLEGIFALLWPEGPYRRPEAVAGDTTLIAPEPLWDDLAELLAPFAADLRAHMDQPLAAGRSRRAWLPWAALMHDWGKPAMRTVEEDGRVRFFEHDHWGALLAGRRADALKLADDEGAYLARLVDGHMRPAHLAHDFPPSRRAIYHFYRDLGQAGPDCVLLSLADHLATLGALPEADAWARRRGASSALLHAYFRERAERINPPALLNGHQVMAEFGLRPGPQVGALLEGLREAQAAGEVQTPDDARAWLVLNVKMILR